MSSWQFWLLLYAMITCTMSQGRCCALPTAYIVFALWWVSGFAVVATVLQTFVSPLMGW